MGLGRVAQVGLGVGRRRAQRLVGLVVVGRRVALTLVAHGRRRTLPMRERKHGWDTRYNLRLPD